MFMFVSLKNTNFMKKILSYSVFILSIVLFNSCENEPLTGFDLTDSGTSGTTSGNNGAGSGGTSSGDYYPRNIGNTWNYSSSAGGTNQNLTSEIVNNFTDTSGNNVYELTQSTLSNGTAAVTTSGFVYKDGGNYYAYSNEIQVDYGGGLTATQTAIPTYVFLKDNVAVGTSWNVSFTQVTSFNDPSFPNVTLNINYLYEIVGNDLTKTVNGVDYSPVIEVKLTGGDTTSGQDINANYFYALDVGLIKIEQNGQDSSVLDSYTIN